MAEEEERRDEMAQEERFRDAVAFDDDRDEEDGTSEVREHVLPVTLRADRCMMSIRWCLCTHLRKTHTQRARTHTHIHTPIHTNTHIPHT